MEILLVDDHVLVLQGLRSILEGEAEIESVHTAVSYEKAIQIIENTPSISIVLTDLQMPGKSGFELIETISYRFPAIKIIAVSMVEEPILIQKTLEKGAKGYVFKNEKKENLITAIKTVSLGGQYTSPKIMQALLNKTQTSEILTAREKEIAIVIAEGRKNQEVAEKLNISIQTVATHRKNVYKKLNLSNTAALVKYVSEQGWL